MKRPPLATRVIGYPPVTFSLLALYAGVWCAWYLGYVHLIVALSTLAMGKKTLALFVDRLGYHIENMPMPWQPPTGKAGAPPKKFTAWAVIRVAVPVAVCLGSGYCLHLVDADGSAAQMLRRIWWSAVLCLLWMIARWWWRRSRKQQQLAQALEAAPVVKVEPVVTWLLEVPKESPSREMIERELPDYCLRLMKGTELQRL